MKLPVFFLFLASCTFAQADCPSTLPLKGFLGVDNCYPSTKNCNPADKVLYQYMDVRKDDDPEVLFIGLHGSPWHLYHGDYHILEIEELAQMVRQQGTQIKRVVLLASWSGVAPDRHSMSLAQKLSVALKGMPVTGQNGFLWFSRNGAVHTTQQAFTGVTSGPYSVKTGEKVMASLVAGWPAGNEAAFAKNREGALMMRAGVGADIFTLCPERALKAFEASAALSDPIAAFNAAVMLLERGANGDASAAMALLKQAAALGDKKAQAKLNSLAATAPR